MVYFYLFWLLKFMISGWRAEQREKRRNYLLKFFVKLKLSSEMLKGRFVVVLCNLMSRRKY